MKFMWAPPLTQLSNTVVQWSNVITWHYNLWFPCRMYTYVYVAVQLDVTHCAVIPAGLARSGHHEASYTVCDCVPTARPALFWQGDMVGWLLVHTIFGMNVLQQNCQYVCNCCDLTVYYHTSNWHKCMWVNGEAVQLHTVSTTSSVRIKVLQVTCTVSERKMKSKVRMILP